MDTVEMDPEGTSAIASQLAAGVEPLRSSVGSVGHGWPGRGGAVVAEAVRDLLAAEGELAGRLGSELAVVARELEDRARAVVHADRRR